tara:strand:- start:9 stop:539 length:531 start_codon:yes stop_codon:yes gene_type:complete
MGGPGSGRQKTIGPRLNQVRFIPPCGTPAMYQRHRKKGENCELCRRAASKAAAARSTRVLVNRQKNSIDIRMKMRQVIIDEKIKRSACMDCFMPVTVDITYVFDFDHRDPLEKLFTISKMYKGVSYASLYKEMDKCDLVCANCHRHRTQRQFRTKVLTGFSLRPETKQLTLFEGAS